MRLNPVLFLIGALASYFLDPDRGRRRRAMLRDRGIHGLHVLTDAVDVTERDFSNRAHGWLAETRARFGETHERPPDDDVLVARVRSALGRLVSHPGSVEVAARDGRVELRGPVFRRELRGLVPAVYAVHGVLDVVNHLEPHETAGKVSGLQGGEPGRRRRPRPELLQRNWSPTARFLGGLAGLNLALYALRRRGTSGLVVGSFGGGLLARAVTNMETRRLFGFGRDRSMRIHKTIHIAAPVEQVYAYWSDLSNFPSFMEDVREVRRLADGTYQWVVAGPAGMPISWRSQVTRSEPHRLLAWRTVPGSTVRNGGSVRFIDDGELGTRVDVDLSYDPPAGGIGHAIARVFRADPKTKLHEDLMRMKQRVESVAARETRAA
jgi:uncharacterized membrane protein